jgi:hypothetical protein
MSSIADIISSTPDEETDMNATETPTVIQTLDGFFYRVSETGSADLAHVWNGVRVMRKFDEWVDRKNARVELVRKVGAKVFA